MGTDVLNGAICFATEKHAGIMRKGTETPYIVHPMEAAAIAATMTDDPEVIAAAVLHDVAEDAGVSAEELAERFGERVARLVMSESENKREGQDKAKSWKRRKQETIKQLRESVNVDVKIIALSDKLSNMRNIYRDYLTIGEDLWKRFNQKDKIMHGWYYLSVADALSELSDTFAWKEYRWLIHEVFEKNWKEYCMLVSEVYEKKGDLR